MMNLLAALTLQVSRGQTPLVLPPQGAGETVQTDHFGAILAAVSSGTSQRANDASRAFPLIEGPAEQVPTPNTGSDLLDVTQSRDFMGAVPDAFVNPAGQPSAAPVLTSEVHAGTTLTLNAAKDSTAIDVDKTPADNPQAPKVPQVHTQGILSTVATETVSATVSLPTQRQLNPQGMHSSSPPILKPEAAPGAEAKRVGAVANAPEQSTPTPQRASFNSQLTIALATTTQLQPAVIPQLQAFNAPAQTNPPARPEGALPLAAPQPMRAELTQTVSLNFGQAPDSLAELPQSKPTAPYPIQVAPAITMAESQSSGSLLPQATQAVPPQQTLAAHPVSTTALPAIASSVQSAPLPRPGPNQSPVPVSRGLIVEAKPSISSNPTVADNAPVPDTQESQSEVTLAPLQTRKDVAFQGDPKPTSVLMPATPIQAPEPVAPTVLAADQPTDIDVAASRPTPSGEALAKPAQKPFATAILAQVRAVTAQEGRTVFNLQPQGLGALEVEVVSEQDAAARVVVRVENPMVLQALREDRHLLAQTIGMPDGTQVEFQGHAQHSDHSGTDKHTGGNSEHSSAMAADAEPATPDYNDKITDGAVDILT